MKLRRGTPEGVEPESRGVQPPSQRSQRRGRYSTRNKILGTVAVLVAFALVAVTLTAYLTYRRDWNGVRHIDVAKDLNTKRPPADPNAMNILVIGSDTRSGANEKFGAGVLGERSDTIMVLHIAPYAHQAVVLSIPRDSVVPILKCSPEPGAPGQSAQPAPAVEQINATFAYGGPGCLWKTIEQTTHIRLSDFIELTFTGFEHVVNDLGGVNVCLPVRVHDQLAGLYLSAGMHHIDGKQALAFWRVRYIGEGSDLERIQRDQFLMASMLQGIERSGLLHSPTKLLSVINDVTSHGYIATDTGLSAGRLFKIAEELRGLSPSLVQFIQVPTVPYPGNPQAWVQWQQPQAGRLFAAIAHNSRLPKTRKKRKARAPSLDSVRPSQVNVTVLNGSGVPGVATTASASLAARGFHLVGQPADAASMDYTTSVVEYARPADLAAARTLAGQLSDVKLQRNPGLTPGTIELILGTTYTGLKAESSTAAAASSVSSKASKPAPSSSASAGTLNLTPKYGGIKGNAAICSDSSAFAGPDGNN